MTIEESRRSQRPYRYGMVLLCVGALINWLGLAEHYVEPVRYVGVACIVAGALLICAAMCCWLHAPPTRTSTHIHRTTHVPTVPVDDSIHVISMEEPSSGARQKPPDYEAVADPPPSYDDAIKLNPAQLAQQNHRNSIGAISAISTELSIPGTVLQIDPPTHTPPPPYARYF
ncbi:hypothetical protein TKK_0013316 [Trichogramma kaykai]|uniref:Uncharacterized protein n=1 Tax=Trichogramma kaykai TaxID=54128 RepID=A0ABD2WJ40_9HYME